MESRIERRSGPRGSLLVLIAILLLQTSCAMATPRRRPFLILRGGQDSFPDESMRNSESTIRQLPQASTCLVGNSTFIAPLSHNSKSSKNTKKASTRGKKSKQKSSTSSPQSSALSRSDTARRIQREWRDLVLAGMGYDWQANRPVRTKRMDKDTIEQHIWIGPLSMQNLYIWHFSFLGVEGSPYENGIYHGRIVLPRDYPANPPHVQLWTPSGRFVVRTNICLSASSYHPETWTASWTIRTLTQALRLHMLTHGNEIGGISTCSNAERSALAKESKSYHVQIKYGDSSKRSITVNHAAMIRDGLFPLTEERSDLEEKDLRERERGVRPGEGEKVCEQNRVVSREHVLDTKLEEIFEQKKDMRSIQQQQSRLSNRAVTVSVSSILKEAFGSPLKVAVYAFLIIFVLLNRQ